MPIRCPHCQDRVIVSGAYHRHRYDPVETEVARDDDSFECVLCGACHPGRLLRLIGHKNSVSGVSFSPAGNRIASGSGDGTVKIWDAGTGREIFKTPIADGFYSVRRVFRKITGPDPDYFSHLNSMSVCFSPDGKRIASGGPDKMVKIWDVVTGQEALAFEGAADFDKVKSVSFSPDGTRVVSGGDDMKVNVWDVETGQKILTLAGHSGAVSSVCFSPDGTRIASSGHVDSVKVWDAETGQEMFTQEGHSSFVTFSSDGRWIVSSGDLTVKIWDADTGQESLVFDIQLNEVTTLAVSPDGKRIAGGGMLLQDTSFNPTQWSCGAIKVLDTETGRELLTLRGKGSPWNYFRDYLYAITCVRFSPDGKRIVSSSHDKTVKVWDISSLDASK